MFDGTLWFFPFLLLYFPCFICALNLVSFEETTDIPLRGGTSGVPGDTSEGLWNVRLSAHLANRRPLGMVTLSLSGPIFISAAHIICLPVVSLRTQHATAVASQAYLPIIGPTFFLGCSWFGLSSGVEGWVGLLVHCGDCVVNTACGGASKRLCTGKLPAFAQLRAQHVESIGALSVVWRFYASPDRRVKFS